MALRSTLSRPRISRRSRKRSGPAYEARLAGDAEQSTVELFDIEAAARLAHEAGASLAVDSPAQRPSSPGRLSSGPTS